MKIKSINITNYRNYTNQAVDFRDGLNVIIGKNAQGKTNLLEAVFICAIGRSPRTTKDKDLIRWESTYAKISLGIEKKLGSKEIDIYLFNNQNKAIKIDKIGIKRIGQLMGNFNAIYFSPDELKLIKESPEERRKFMDIDLCQFNKNYFYTLSNYNKVLQQRNKLLKTSNELVLKETISIWNDQLASSGASLIMARLKLVENLKEKVRKIHKFLTNEKENLEISYQGYTADSENDLKLLLLKKYDEAIDKDIKLGFTTVGPHRDDIKIESNGIDLRAFGSQGQQRTAALSLKLAELEVFKDNIGEYPVLLLDDVLSELDPDRQLKLLEFTKPIQTILTCTEFNFDIPHTKFNIENGKLKSTELSSQ